MKYVFFYSVVTCAAPGSVANSSMAPEHDSYNYSMAITYACTTGYERMSGDLIRTCEASGTWSGAAPVCTSRFH